MDLDEEERHRINVFDWEREFREIFRGSQRQLWFVTFVTHNSRISERMITYGVEAGEPLVFSSEDQIFMAERISEACHNHGIAIVAYNVLPDHVHMVVAAETEKELNEHVRKIKGYSSYAFQRARGWDSGQSVWAQKFNREPITEEASLRQIVEYVLNNHHKHAERWDEQLIATWEIGKPDKGLKPLVQIVRSACAGARNLSEGSRS